MESQLQLKSQENEVVEGSSGSPNSRNMRRFLFIKEKGGAKFQNKSLNITFCLKNTFEDDVKLRNYDRKQNYTMPDCGIFPNCTIERIQMQNTRLWCDFHYFGAIGQVCFLLLNNKILSPYAIYLGNMGWNCCLSYWNTYI